MPEKPKIIPLSESAVIIRFGNEISEELNDRALGLAAYIEKHPFPGFIEAVPAYASTAVYFDPVRVRKAIDEPLPTQNAVRREIENALAQDLSSNAMERATVDIPVEFTGEDLGSIADATGSTREKVVEIFLSRTYRVYMIGFLPGFAYMGEVDERIAMPRKETPRKAVPKGSVGIAGKQTGIYPLESPGGWQLLGHTPLEMFAPAAPQPCLLKPGDDVQFIDLNA